MSKLNEIEGIGESFAAKLAGAGVKSTNDLLEKCSTPAGRKEIAEKSGVAEKKILRWTNMADLFRIKGVGEEYADLLEAAGVDTVPELGQRKAANLLAKMTEVNGAKKLVRALPTEDKVSAWVEQAKKLPRKVNY
jgi:predicted flap endonuclease-1-like 5' DNA nuclease